MPMEVGASVRRTGDPDEANEIAANCLYPQRLDVLDCSASFDMTLYGGRIGPVFIADCIYQADVRISCGELATSYHVNMPLSGHLETTQSHNTVVATPQTAAVYRPTGDTVLDRWSGGCRQLCVKIEKDAVETGLIDLVGHGLPGPLALDPSMDIGTGGGKSWLELVTMINTQLHQPDSAIHNPIVAAPLVQALIHGLLVGAGHPHHESLDTPSITHLSTLIQKAVDFMEDHAQEPITTADIAAHCCIGVRALQAGFQRQIGSPPLRYLRGIRLRRAHDDLLRADPYTDTVGLIANRWGFTHLGRFAALHEAHYGEPPSHVLRAEH